MPKTLGILAIGSELLDGRVIDTNSRYIGERVSSTGIRVTAIHTSDDVESEIQDALSFILGRADTVIVLGGLGPTDDDLTREAIASFAKVPLVEDADWLAQIRKFFSDRKRIYDESNRKQALVPRGGSIIHNSLGTASGFKLFLPETNKTIFALPGVPSEMEEMFESGVFPYFRSETAIYKEIFRVFGLPEATVGGRVNALNLPSSIKVSYRAKFPEIQVILSSTESLLREASIVESSIGREFIFSRDLSVGIEGSLHNILLRDGLTISTAESCTGGLIAKLLTDTPGASAYFIGGVNAYSNKIKEKMLSVSSNSLANHGAVSSAVACEMAEGVRRSFGTSIGLSVTGTAGPDGGSKEKPVGTFYIGFSSDKETSAELFLYPGTRSKVRQFAAYTAIDLVRRRLLGLKPLTL